MISLFLPRNGPDESLVVLFADTTATNRRGEQTAAAMENKLTSLEKRIDDLLASVDEKSGDDMQGKAPSARGTAADATRNEKAKAGA